MSSALTTKKAVIIIGSLSAAIVCASAAYRYFSTNKRRNSSSIRQKSSLKGKTRKSPKVHFSESTDTEVIEREVHSESSLLSDQEENMTTTTVSYSNGESGRGGRRDYRHHRRNRDETATTASGQLNGHVAPANQENGAISEAPKSAFQALTSVSNGISKQLQSPAIYNDPAIVEVSNGGLVNGDWHYRQQQSPADDDQQDDGYPSVDAELRGAQLAAEFSAKCQTTANSITFFKQQQMNSKIQCTINGENGHTTSAMFQNGLSHDTPSPPLSSIKGQCIESPSLASDLHSEGSQDSGKGASMGLASSISPIEEFIEIPAVYEFEVPQDIVGLLIGKQGTTIKWLTQESQTHIVIRQHFYSDRHKICTLEGTREQINKCLRLIRRKFPPSRFPDLKLTPIIPPPVTASHTPVWDNVIQLNLPESVSCEVVVSSIIDGGHFFLQQPTHPTFSSLARLDQFMGAVYSQPMGIPPLPRPVESGVICAAPILGGWYRAQTMEVYEETDDVLVKFVDYGGYSRIPASELRQIRSDFMTLPFQATECYLAHVKSANEKEGWAQEAASFFEQLSQGKVLEANVFGHTADNIPLVELFLPGQNTNDIMINRLLTENGHAVWTD